MLLEGSTGLTLGEPSAFIVLLMVLYVNLLIYSLDPDLSIQGNNAATVGNIQHPPMAQKASRATHQG
jgi:hypothetical protein